MNDFERTSLGEDEPHTIVRRTAVVRVSPVSNARLYCGKFNDLRIVRP